MDTQPRAAGQNPPAAIRPPIVDRLAADLRSIHREARGNLERLARGKFAERLEARTRHRALFERTGVVFGQVTALYGGRHAPLEIAAPTPLDAPDESDAALTGDLRALQAAIAGMLEAMDEVWPQHP